MSRYSTTGSSYPRWTLTLPEPVPFPRDLFARALEEHARLFEQHLKALTSDLHLQIDELQIPPRELVGTILIGGRPTPNDAEFCFAHRPCASVATTEGSYVRSSSGPPIPGCTW